MPFAPPQIFCAAVARCEHASWPEIDRAFAPWCEVALAQGWRNEPDPNFRPAFARFGWTPDALWVRATLHDDDIWSEANGQNGNTWELGDCFELFLRPLPTARYFELHLTPHAHALELEFAGEQNGKNWREPRPRRDLWSFRRVEICPQTARWELLAAVSFAALGHFPDPARKTRWLFSVSRYDYSRHIPTPVLSSSSPHTQPNFHRQNEWGTLIFE